MKICIGCSVSFTPETPWSKYCSKKCQWRSSQKKFRASKAVKKSCVFCGTRFLPKGAKKYCSKKCRVRASQRAWAEKYRVSTFGVTLDSYDEQLVRQNGRCYLCGSTEPGGVKNRFAIDHNHETGSVRGLLCDKCNLALGLINDRVDVLENMISYLNEDGIWGG